MRAAERYAGPIYGRQVDVLCLHCIASGEAARALTGAAEWPCMFTDATDVPQDVPFAVVEEVTQRTPGFYSWEQPELAVSLRRRRVSRH